MVMYEYQRTQDAQKEVFASLSAGLVTGYHRLLLWHACAELTQDSSDCVDEVDVAENSIKGVNILLQPGIFYVGETHDSMSLRCLETPVLCSIGYLDPCPE